MKYIYDNDSGSYGLCSSFGSSSRIKISDAFGNCKTKTYPDGSTNSIICRTPIFKKPDFEKTKLCTIFERLGDTSIHYTLEKGTSFPVSRKPETDEELSAVDFSSYSPKIKEKLSKIFVYSPCSKEHDMPEFNKKVKFKLNADLKTIDYSSGFEKTIGFSEFKVSLSSSCVKKLPEFKKISLTPIPEKVKNSRIRHDSIKRAKDSIFDYAFCNKFDYFFTGTINPKKLNSKSPAELLKPVQSWLKNYRLRYGIEYIMVAEYHKKGGIHFHGLINFGKLTLIDSGTKSYEGFKKPMKSYKAKRKGFDPEKDGKTVYNVPNWRFGFTTCIKTYGDSCAVSRYISKYLTKDCSKIFGKFFWHSRGLKKPDISVDTVDYDAIPAKEYFNCYKYVFSRGEENRQVFLEIVETEDDIIFDGNLCYSSLTGEVYFDCSPPPDDEWIDISY